jgi:hypothetical protein
MLRVLINAPIIPSFLFFTFCIVSFYKCRKKLRCHPINRDLVRLTQFVTLLLLLSGIGTLSLLIVNTDLSSTDDLERIVRLVLGINFMGITISLVTLLAVWSLYWALRTSPIEELGNITAVLLVGGLVAVWAQAGRIAGAGFWANLFLIGSIGAAFALDVYTLVLLCGLLMGKQFRVLTMRWRVFVCTVAGIAGITLVQERLAYDVNRSLGTLTGQNDLLKLAGLQTFLWLLIAIFWALAVLMIDTRALKQETSQSDSAKKEMLSR